MTVVAVRIRYNVQLHREHALYVRVPDGGREQCTCSLRPLHPSSSASFPIFPCTRYWGASCSLFCSPCLDACCSAVLNGCGASIHAHSVDERVLGPAEEHHGLLFRGEVRAVPGQLRCRFPIPHHVHKHERLSDDIPIPSPVASLTPGVALHAKRPGQQDGSVHPVPPGDKQSCPCVGAERVRACPECLSVPAVSLFAISNA